MSADHESQPPTLELVERYVAGELPPNEAEQVSVYLATHPTAKVALDALRTAVSLAGREDGAEWRWAALAKRLEVEPVGPVTGATPSARGARRDGDGRWSKWKTLRSNGPLTRRFAAAGALVAAVVVLYAAVFTGRHGGPASRRYITKADQVMTLQLADGTRITLAPQTSLTVAEGFGVRHRDVAVTGMARFDVASASGVPFTVQTGRVTTQVLGTTFSVRHYHDDQDVVVAVASGKVVARSIGSHVLGANMLARFADSTVLVSSGMDLKEYMEWTSGHLVFKEAPVEEVMATLGRWYGLEFRFADSTLARQHVTGSFRAEAQQEVLQTVQLMLGVRMVFDGNIVTLVPGRAVAAPAPSPAQSDVAPPSHTEVGR